MGGRVANHGTLIADRGIITMLAGDRGTPSSPTPTESSKRGATWLPARAEVATTSPGSYMTLLSGAES